LFSSFEEESTQNVNSMPEATATDPIAESERLDVATDQAIAACGGDMRSTIRALILANEFLEAELDTQVSHGYPPIMGSIRSSTRWMRNTMLLPRI
jgi:hypothetical protein